MQHKTFPVEMKEFVQRLLPLYVKTLDKPVESKVDPLNLKCPQFVAAKKAEKSKASMEIFLTMVAGLPMPYIFPVEECDQAILHSWGKMTLLEYGIFFGLTRTVNELLKFEGYLCYAKERAEPLAEKALAYGNFDLAKRFLELAGTEMKPRHLLMTLKGCGSAECLEVLAQVSVKVSAEEILACTDKDGNTVLHLVAMLGRRDFLFALQEAKVFDFSHPSPSALVRKNALRCCPFVVAIQNDNIDIANALYVRSKGMDELSDDEFNVITAPTNPTKALSQLRDPKRYPQEAKLWSALYPQREQIIRMFDRLAELAFYERVEPKKRITAREQHKHVHTIEKKEEYETPLKYVEELVKKGNVGQLLSLIVFRKDVFRTVAMMDPVFKPKVGLYAALMKTRSMAPLAGLFVSLGFAPTTKDEIEELFAKPELLDERTILLMLQILSIIPLSSSQSAGKAPADSLFAAPHDFFFGKHFILGTRTEFAPSELLCLLGPPEEDASHHQNPYGLDLAALALRFFHAMHFRAFMTLFLYAHKHEPAVFAKVVSQLGTNDVCAMFFHEHPECLSLAVTMIPERFEMRYDRVTGSFKDTEGTEIGLSTQRNSATALIYLATNFADRLIKIAGEDTATEKIKQILSYVTYDQLGVYGNARSAKKSESKCRVVELNSARRGLRIWTEVVQRLREISQGDIKLNSVASFSPPHPLISESDLARTVAELLDPTGIVFHTGNGFMTVRVDVQELLQSVLSSDSPVSEVSRMFTDKFALAVDEIRDAAEKYIISIKVQFVRQPKEPMLRHKLSAITEQEVPKEFLDGCTVAGGKHRLYHGAFQAHRVEVELIANPVGDSTATGDVEKLNAAIYTEIALGLVAKLSPIEMKADDHQLQQVYTIDVESVHKHIGTLEAMFSTDVSSRLDTLVRNEVGTLFNQLQLCEKEYSKLLAVPPLLQDPALAIPAAAKHVLTLFPHRNNAGVFTVSLKSADELKELKEHPSPEKAVVDSMRFCADPTHHLDGACKLSLELPTDMSMQSPERWLLPETHAEFLGLKVFAAEARAVMRLISLTRSVQPYIRIDMEKLLREVAIPISREVSKLSQTQTNNRYSHPLLVVEEFCDFSALFPAVIKRLVTQLCETGAKFGRETAVLLVSFAEGKKGLPEVPSEGLPLVDRLIRFTDCELRSEGPEGNVCTVTLMYENTWGNGPELARILAADTAPKDNGVGEKPEPSSEKSAPPSFTVPPSVK